MTQPTKTDYREEKIVTREDKSACCHGPGYQAFQILRFAFTVVPIIAGLDKFFNFLTNWSVYLSPQFDVFKNPSRTMLVVGIIEIIAGFGVWLKPKIFAYIVALWLLGIIVNLFLLGNHYDIALRDFGLLLGALALGRLSSKHDISCRVDTRVERRDVDASTRIERRDVDGTTRTERRDIDTSRKNY